ncbi:virulence factor SrfC family protein [Succinimonas amylolytica]|uniref:virulence factor SrfC family protein n=1 Tax=Succinimonas amylolytica TaxID=83769 RepID=UPI0023A794D6
MSDMENSRLDELWGQVNSNSKKARKWVEVLAKNNPKVKAAEKSLTYEACKAIYEAEKMNRIFENRPGIGLFGESQAGKSYLVSAMASDDSNSLVVKLGDERIDFVHRINPQGSGKESTGLVTRFTKSSFRDVQDKKFPVKLVFLSEYEVVMILVNSFYADFEDTNTSVTEDIENNLTEMYEDVGKCSHADTSLSDTGIILLENYIKNRYHFLHRELDEKYWDFGRKKAIRRKIDCRAKYYEVLWGKNPDYTRLFKRLATVLEKLTNPYVVYAPVDAVEATGDRISLINVDALKNLKNENCSKDREIEVRISGENYYIYESDLAALTAEISMPVENPRYDIIKSNDILDFPGYRGRLDRKLEDLNSNSELIAEAFLRGKVAYLFEKYTENYELNALILCTASDSQINSPQIEKVITSWIGQTQGKSSPDRARHSCGLFWALTKFDKRIIDDLDKEENRSYGKRGLLQQTVLEKFGHCSWLENWNGNTDNPQPFNNIFLVRKPGIDCSFIQRDGTVEKSVRTDYQERLNRMKADFCRDPDIQNYVGDPERSWDEVIKVNDGGLSNLIAAISEVDIGNIRLNAIKSKLREISEELVRTFRHWISEGDMEEVRKKKKENSKLVGTVCKKKFEMFKFEFGDFINIFNMPLQKIKLAWDDIENENLSFITDNSNNNLDNSKVDKSSDDFIDFGSDDDDYDIEDDDFDFVNMSNDSEDIEPVTDISDNGDMPQQEQKRELSSEEKLYNRWTEWMHGISSSQSWDTVMLPLKPDFIDVVASEIVDYAERSELRNRFVKYIEYLKNLSKDSKEAKNIIPEAASRIFSDFIYSLNKSLIKPYERINNVYDLNLSEKVDSNEKYMREWLTEFVNNTILKNADLKSSFGFTRAQEEEIMEIVEKYREIKNAV